MDAIDQSTEWETTFQEQQKQKVCVVEREGKKAGEVGGVQVELFFKLMSLSCILESLGSH